MPDYEDWISRFLGIYRYPTRGEIEKVQLAIDWLKESHTTDEELEKIWAAQVERNIYRDRCVRERKPITRDPVNLLRFFKDKLWGNLIPTKMDEILESARKEQKCKCGSPAFLLQPPGPLCCWCYSKDYCNDGPTGLDKLREAYQSRKTSNAQALRRLNELREYAYKRTA